MSIYKEFCSEILDENGALKSLTLDYPEDFNFGYDVVDRLAERFPDKRALVWCNLENEEHIFTFSDIKRESNRIANALSRCGIRRGDRVLMILKRHYEYWFTAIALHKLGAVMIPATHMLTTDDLVYRLKASGAKAAVVTTQNELPKRLLEASRLAGVRLRLFSVQEDADGFENLTRLALESSCELKRVPTLSTDPMMLYFTSGTTGYPKGVIHDHSYPLAHIVTAKYWQQAEDGGLHFTVAETGWAKASWGKMYGQWLIGSAVMVYDFDNFDPKQLVSVINRYRVTSFCAPPTVYRYLVRKGIPDMPSLKHASTAGETLAPEVFKKFKERTGLSLCEGYGQTETTLLLANFKGFQPIEGSMGRPSPFYSIELRGKDGRPVGVNEIGEIVVLPDKSGRHPGIFTGYLDNEEQYRACWRDGVYHTGDAAYIDENGCYWFHGRFDDIIKTGGFRVGPYEVENILMEHPAVLECSVIGIPDPLRGQAIKAVIVTAPGYSPSQELELEIKNFGNSRLAEYKWIRSVEFTASLPKTISGKIQKSVLRSQCSG
ncbi:MAG TPA: AMP-binding protein [Candidatus Faeciplasma avium]|uniref:AMP-binding protein n=1 Tax=Candidatus Faeciplasma avium TaxID=2840798 RepID=A0A9D1NR06_9FIRM|nr:AMP-binding protein [Candidatus Faeciplasma avium]